VLSGRGKRLVDLDTFIVGCIKLRGAAKSMDIALGGFSDARGDVS